MLYVETKRIMDVQQASAGSDLYEPLQAAIELEHSTIPLYFTAYLSLLNAPAMEFISDTLRDVFVEEMLHMAIVCNVLNAIGGAPEINKPNFVPQYPGPLPMVGNFEVHLRRFSEPQLDVFLQIEEPEGGALPFPVAKAAMMESAAHYSTIGEFYSALMQKITELGDSAFTGNISRQVIGTQISAFEDQLFAITSAAEAVAALKVIVQQGEGTKTTPLEAANGNFAHYYRFSQIKKRRMLVPDANFPLGYSYSGDPILWTGSAATDMVEDPKVANYKAGSAARAAVEAFNLKYSRILDQLQLAFNGQPAAFSLGGMFGLRTAGKQVIALTDEVTGKKAAPSFEYTPA
jgi:Ferritin-like